MILELAHHDEASTNQSASYENAILIFPHLREKHTNMTNPLLLPTLVGL